MKELSHDKGRIRLDQGKLWYDPYFIDPDGQSELYRDCMESLPWRQDTIQVFGKSYAQPRLTCLLGDAGTHYTYSGIRMESIPFSPTLDQLRQRINREFGWNLNLCLANLYRDGKDSNGWHSDDEKELGPDPAIASVSLGSERYFQLRSKVDRSDTYKILLKSGSLLLMYPPTQRFWQHQIPKTQRSLKPRINLTFRTFYTSECTNGHRS